MTKIQSPEPERHHPNDVKRLKENDSAVVTRMNIDAVGYIGSIALIFFFRFNQYYAYKADIGLDCSYLKQFPALGPILILFA